MSISSLKDFEGMKHASEVVAETLRRMIDHARPGMSTKDLDEFGFEILQKYCANPAPNKEYDFPGWTCISVNQEAAHGIPSHTKVLCEGDLINIDVSAEVNGYYGDNGCSFVLGEDIQNLNPLVSASREILLGAIDRIKGGVKISSIGDYIEKEARKRGFTTLKNLVGHGIGLKLHDEPFELPNFNDLLNRQRFKANTVVALETFISTRSRYVHAGSDGWTLKAKDGSFVAQHEHTLLITDDLPVILTSNNGI